MNQFINKLPTLPIILMGSWMAIAPVFPEPHLVQKFLMAMNGDAFRLIDVFDVLMHGGLGLLAAVKLWRVVLRRSAPDAAESAK